MPVIVRELIIRARVEEVNSPGNNGAVSSSDAGSSASAKTEDIVAICVEKVMEAIELKKDR